tara:strand:- start:191 stop:2083 length:1893 start_codon:yes stop_codon:yes gene_type:complete
MNFMNRQMFQNGGGATALGPYDILDTKTGQITTVRPNFINTPGFNPYKILSDSSLEKGPAVMTILQQFKERDAPQIGPFQMSEDIGTNISDLGFGVARATEPFIRGASRAVGEITGIQGLKNFGGKQTFSPSIGLGGIDLFKPTYESYVPTDEDRARGMLGLVKERDGSILDPITGAIDDLISTSTDRSSFDFRDEDMRSKVSQAEFNKFQTSIEPVFDPYNDPITPMLDDLSQQRIDLEDRFAEEDIQRPADIDVDEITSLLNDIETPGFDLNKTEADSLLETTNKFEGLSPDELKFELDKTKLPGMDSLNEQKAQVEKQVKIIKALESKGIDPDTYFNTARNPVSKKLNEPGFFGSNRFLDFIRNVGAGLTETGQVGSGLGLGASKAAEERAARDIAKDEREYEMEKLIAIEDKKAEIARIEKLNAPMEATDLVKYVKFEDEISTALKNFDEDERIVSDINQILNEDVNDPTAFGATGFLGKINDKFRNALGLGEQEWADLPAEVRTERILKITSQRSVRSILGESGKTISNLDRQIVAEIFGNVNIWTSPAELKKILGSSRSTIIENMRSTQNQILSRANAFKKAGYKSPVLYANESLIDRILGFSFDNIEQYKRGDSVSGFKTISL